MSLSPTFKPCSPDGVSDLPRDGILGAVSDWVRTRIIAPLELQRERRALRAELAGLDRRELSDLGINPDGVDGFVAVWTPGRR